MRTKSRYALAGGSSSAVSRNQELDISFGSRDRAWGDSLDTPSEPFQPVRNRPADALMHCGVAHHAALADLASLRLELRLDQRDQAPAGRGEIERRIEHLGETAEARVSNAEGDRPGNVVGDRKRGGGGKGGAGRGRLGG